MSHPARARTFSRSSLSLLVAGVLLCASGCSRGRLQAQAAPVRRNVAFIGEWGRRGEAPGQLDDPAGLAIGDAGRVFIANRGTGFVQKFEVDGVPLLAFADPIVRHAAAIAVDSGGAIYVADPRRGRISIFFPQGQPLRQMRVAAQPGFEGLFTFSVDEQGAIYVPDPAGGRIQVLNPRGRVERVWKVRTGSGQAAHPAMAVAGPDGFIYVGDPGSGRIVKFSREGRQVSAWGQMPGDGTRLLGLAVSRLYVFALRDASPRLEIWTTNGRQVLADDLGGRLSSAAAGVGIAWAGDELLLLDSAGPHVLRFRIHLAQHP